jgi:hypothetical protein
LSINPYAPPKAAVADIVSHEESAPLWNPNAAANWSLFFSPAFGAYLQMKNWQALGEPDKASTSKAWFVAVLVILLALPLVAALVPGMSGLLRFSSPVGVALLIAWYVSSGRGQARYVKERFGKNYPRKGWGLPLLGAVGVLFGYFIVVAVLAFVLATLGIVGK